MTQLDEENYLPIFSVNSILQVNDDDSGTYKIHWFAKGPAIQSSQCHCLS